MKEKIFSLYLQIISFQVIIYKRFKIYILTHLKVRQSENEQLFQLSRAFQKRTNGAKPIEIRAADDGICFPHNSL